MKLLIDIIGIEMDRLQEIMTKPQPERNQEECSEFCRAKGEILGRVFAAYDVEMKLLSSSNMS